MKTVTLKVVIEVPDNYVMEEPEWTLEDSILNSESECEICSVDEFPQFKPTEDYTKSMTQKDDSESEEDSDEFEGDDSEDESGLATNDDSLSENFYLVNVPGKHGYSFMVKTILEDESDILEKCSELDLFNDEDDVTYASVSEADKYDREHFKEFNYLDR